MLRIALFNLLGYVNDLLIEFEIVTAHVFLLLPFELSWWSRLREGPISPTGIKLNPNDSFGF